MTLSSDASHSKSRTEEISAILRDEILSGQYRAGERLPSERDLAARFATNRGAVRESLKKLEQLGIASIKPGGVRVVPIEEASLSILGHLLELEAVPNARLVGHVLDVLGALIAQSARSAVEAATPAQLDEMQTQVQTLVETVDDPELSQQNWKILARQFASINNNLVLHLILNGLKTQFVGRLDSLGLQVKLPRQRNIEALQTLAQGIKKRHPETVTNAITGHFVSLRESVQQALLANAQQQPVNHGPLAVTSANPTEESH
jgi:GntR family transcriptional repressor for pyruvate dehydrogenase complex